MKKNKVLINYYARIILRGNWKIEDVPENLREDVEKAMEVIKEEFEFSGITS